MKPLPLHVLCFLPACKTAEIRNEMSCCAAPVPKPALGKANSKSPVQHGQRLSPMLFFQRTQLAQKPLQKRHVPFSAHTAVLLR